MPPRRRATAEADDQAQTPAPDPAPEQPETPAAPAAHEQPEQPETPDPVTPDPVTPDPVPVIADEGWEASAAALDSGPTLCRDHYPDPIPTSVTAVACEHGSWIRTGS